MTVSVKGQPCVCVCDTETETEQKEKKKRLEKILLNQERVNVCVPV